MRFGSVCSGIEAASAAWLPLGWQCQFMSEIEALPRAVLKHHHSDTPLHGDFTTIRDGDYGPIDLLVGGTPCQSFSVAGLRGGMADARGNLALEYLRLADRLRPAWLLWENVPGVLSSNGGRDFGSFLGGMGQLGYGFAYRVLDAQFFGLAQRRKRVFVVGYLGDWRRAAAVLFEPASLRRDHPPSREAREGVANTLTAGSPDGSGYRNDPSTDTLIAPVLTGNPYGDHEGREGLLVAHSLRADGFDASEDGTGRGTPIVPVCFPWQAGGNADAKTSFPCDENLSGTLTKNQTHAVMTLASRGREGLHQLEVRTDGLANALLTPNGGHGGIGCGAVAFDVQQITSRANRTRCSSELPASTLVARSKMHVAGTMAVRRLTPRECERLQGFPDDFTRVPLRTLKSRPRTKHFAKFPDLYDLNQDGTYTRFSADGPRYKALGNSMAVPVMEWIGRRMAWQHRISFAQAAE